MIRSNSKEARSRLGAWLLKTETGWDGDPTTAEEAAQIVAGFFNDYLGAGNFRAYELRRCKSYQCAFVDWLRGLPCRVGDAIFYEQSARDILGDILNESEEEKEFYTEEEAEEKLASLVWIHYVSGAYFAIAKR